MYSGKNDQSLAFVIDTRSLLFEVQKDVRQLWVNQLCYK
jgi:hypothetical protein